jgi:hypothetical protein
MTNSPWIPPFTIIKTSLVKPNVAGFRTTGFWLVGAAFSRDRLGRGRGLYHGWKPLPRGIKSKSTILPRSGASQIWISSPIRNSHPTADIDGMQAESGYGQAEDKALQAGRIKSKRRRLGGDLGILQNWYFTI